MDYSQYGSQGYNYPPGYSDPYAQQQQYQSAVPQIRNPFAPPQVRTGGYGAQNPSEDQEYDAQLAQWNSAYAPAELTDKGKKDGRGKETRPDSAQIGPRGAVEDAKNDTSDDKKVTVVRKGGGTSWEDTSLLEWDPTQFRIMVGNLAGEVTDDSLAKAFSQYGVSKARVVRDKRTTKSRGYGFVSFTDGELGFKAAREMVGKYIGSHPVTIQRSKTDLRPVTQKDNRHGKNKQNKNRDKGKKAEDPLKAHTGAHIEKKPVKNPGLYKVIG